MIFAPVRHKAKSTALPKSQASLRVPENQRYPADHGCGPNKNLKGTPKTFRTLLPRILTEATNPEGRRARDGQAEKLVVFPPSCRSPCRVPNASYANDKVSNTADQQKSAHDVEHQ